MLRITQLKVLDGYRRWLRYADCVEGEVDLSDLAGRGVFHAWSDRRLFASVRIDAHGALSWPDDLDLCPDELYMRTAGKTAEELFVNPTAVSSGEYAYVRSVTNQSRTNCYEASLHLLAGR
jgi:hypothetical protein